MKPLLIGLSGKAGSGKDTAAEYLMAMHGFRQVAFADPLRAVVSAVFGVPPADFRDREAKEARLADLPAVGLAAVGLGLVLISIVIAINALAWGARRAGERYAG